MLLPTMKVHLHQVMMILEMTLVMKMTMGKVHILQLDLLPQLRFCQMCSYLEILSLQLKDLPLRLRTPPPVLNAGNLIPLMAPILRNSVSSWFNVN